MPCDHVMSGDCVILCQFDHITHMSMYCYCKYLIYVHLYN